MSLSPLVGWAGIIAAITIGLRQRQRTVVSPLGPDLSPELETMAEVTFTPTLGFSVEGEGVPSGVHNGGQVVVGETPYGGAVIQFGANVTNVGDIPVTVSSRFVVRVDDRIMLDQVTFMPNRMPGESALINHTARVLPDGLEGDVSATVTLGDGDTGAELGNLTSGIIAKIKSVRRE